MDDDRDRPGVRGRRAGRADPPAALRPRRPAGRAGEPGRGGRGHRRPARRPSPSTWTGSSTRGCSTSSSSAAPAAPARAPGGPPSCTGAPSATSPVSLPERRYDLAGELLAAAMDEAQTVGGAAARARWPGWPSTGAGSWGGGARGGRGRPGGTSSCGSSRSRASSRGPTTTPSPWPTARSTPWPREHTELVCGMNLRLLDGLLDGVPAPRSWPPDLQPSPGRCCVRLEPSPTET